MSMNFFFKAFESDRIDAMLKDNGLIDAWILKDKKYVDSMDVETAWDILQAALNGNGFAGETAVDDALFNGCLIASPDEVAEQANNLAEWTGERLLTAISELGTASDAYRAEIWTDADGQEELLDHFNNLKSFFVKAADRGWGMVLYAA